MTRQPAWSLDSIALRLDDVVALDALTPEWAFGASRGRGVRVAIVDSGIDADHPALAGAVDLDGGVDVQVGADGEVRFVPGPHDDVFGHGTACAGIVHALAPEASLTSVRVLGPDLTGRAAAFHAGLSWAVDEGFDVINLSLGTTKAEWALAFHEVCDRAYFSGSFVVTAANNVRRTSYPSLFASVTSVACTTSRDPLRFHANPTPPTEFLARGIEVEVPWLDGTTTTTTGNSFAAPHIAALAALIRAKHPALRPFQVKALLWATAANVQEARTTGRPVEAAERAGRPGEVAAPRGTAAAMTKVIRLPAPPSEAPAGRSATSAPPGPPVPSAPWALSSSSRPDAPGPSRGSAPTATTWRIGGYEADGAARGTPWGARIPAHRGDQLVLVDDLRPSCTDAEVAATVVAAVGRSRAVAHPHLDPVLDLVGEGGPMVVTARPAGRLAAPDEGPSVALADALAIALALLSGLDALHRRGLVHGDVRSDAVAVDTTGRVRLGWSGVAAVLGRPGAGVSSPRHLAHLSPEQRAGDLPTPASDVHGVALLLAPLLAGRALHDPGMPGDDLNARRGTAPASAAGWAPGLHVDLVAALDAALDPDPARRPADARTFTRVLAWAADEAVGLAAVQSAPALRVDIAVGSQVLR